MDAERHDDRPGIWDRVGARARVAALALWRLTRAAAARTGALLARRWSDPRVRRRLVVGGRVVGSAALLALLVLGAAALGFERVEPGTVGVRQVNWGSEREIGARDLAPGLYFGPRPFYSWHHLDARTQVLSFAPPSHGGQHPLLELRSASGTTVLVAVCVPYRIRAGEAHAIVSDGLKLAWPMRVKSTVEKVLVHELSKLEAEGFADPAKRRAACDAALTRLNVELAPHHVVAEDVLVRGLKYAPTYEKKKQEEQLASQTLRTNEVLAQLKGVKLENDGLAQQLLTERMQRVAEWEGQLKAEEARWKEQLVEDQKITNQLLELEWQRRKEAVVQRLKDEMAEARRVEHDEPVSARKAENEALARRVARQEAARLDELQRELAQAMAEAERELSAARAANELAAARLAQQERALAAELALANQSARLELEGRLRELQRESEAAVETTRREADAAYASFVAEGERALAEAATLRDRLEAEALARPGARLVLAREAANSLNLERVSLDANDPRVPTVLDLDALVALLVGGGDDSEAR